MRTLLALTLLCATSLPALAYPPAPFHRLYGAVRDENGDPLATGVGAIILSGADGQKITSGISDTSIGPGINYSLSVPLDTGTTAQLYTVSALRPMLPFTIRVVINNVSYLPIEMSGATWTIGEPSGSTRLNLTLGVDSDADGLPDGWELDLIDSDQTGQLTSLDDINPEDDLDGDGLTNRQEYVAGTYALDVGDGLLLDILRIEDGLAQMQFLAIPGRTYSIAFSTDLEIYTPQVFSLLPSGTDATLFFKTDEVRTVDVYVPVGGTPNAFFKLFVQ